MADLTLAAARKGYMCRKVSIATMQQRALLRTAKAPAGKGSLIPAQLRYRDKLNRFPAQCDKAGIYGAHGLCHDYAQRCYAELTYRPCPASVSPTFR